MEINNTASNYIKECSIAGHTHLIIVEFPSSKYVVNQVVTSVAMYILMIPVVFLNGITITTFLKSQHMRAKVCHFPVFIQSMADLSVGLLTLPLFGYLHLSEVFGSPDCVLSFVISTIAFIPWGLSLAALCALSFERYMGVLHPIAHLHYVTKKMFLVYICCVLLVTLIIVPLAVVSAAFYYIFCALYTFTPALLHTFCYSRILYSARKRLRRNNCSSSSEETEPKSSNRAGKRYSSKEMKLAKSCALVVVTFYVFCIPGEILNIYYLEKDIILYRVVIAWFVPVLGVNTILNSVIFFWTRPVLRKEALKVLKGICGN
ncbi:D(2) dopamine receptor-like [Paramuricea clavata]|uniref:D(2) dopamine receptor-like n=1 Tax=Paramuricea clavata TaxID=317549 RepID=A0A7D9I2R4_PARCT|nr:D(2) dopamine receptor-like [Paramuricea clavata]